MNQIQDESHKREIYCIVRKISRGCKKCRKILVLQGNHMERFKDAHINLVSSKDDQCIISPYFFNALSSKET